MNLKTTDTPKTNEEDGGLLNALPWIPIMVVAVFIIVALVLAFWPLTDAFCYNPRGISDIRKRVFRWCVGAGAVLLGIMAVQLFTMAEVPHPLAGAAYCGLGIIAFFAGDLWDSIQSRHSE